MAAGTGDDGPDEGPVGSPDEGSDDAPVEGSDGPDDSPDGARSPASDRLLGQLEEVLLDGQADLTRAQVAERAGVSLETASALWHSLGFPHAGDDDVAFTDADAEALVKATALIRAGVLDEQSQAALVRTWGRSFARLAEWQTELLASVAAADDDPEEKVAELATDVLPLVDDLQSYIWRRHLLGAAGRLLTRPSATDTAAVQGVVFVDIVGYTSQSRNLEQGDLVDLVEHFEEVATSAVTDAGGQVVKTIGDEILFVVEDPAACADVALRLVELHEEDASFPEVRGGAAYGAVVSRLGDVYGPTVNIASRLTSVARPGTLLVDSGLHDALAESDPDQETFRLRRTRRASVKGYHRLEPWRLKRPKNRGS